MTYKGYTGAIEVDEDSGTLFGTVLGTRDLITFVGKTVEEARQSLADSVDFYLERCAATNKEPDKPFTGRFEVRVTPEVHRRIAELAHAWQVDESDVVAEALDRFIAANRPAEYRPPVRPPAQKKKKVTSDEGSTTEAPKRRRASKAG